ncbi:Ig-like domain-containing protein [Roseovarius sp. D0-M9]|uniref:Ig-like domain-containing protein n=1 Tax=Roseovarius sp. D0-M9 TaxID=3127117 RepID=UPI0030104E4C
MNAIDFVARTAAGSSERGIVLDAGQTSVIDTAGASEISLNLRQSDIRGYERIGNDLEITLADGRVIVLGGYFGAGARLFISADGYLNEVTLSEDAGGEIYAQYGPTSEWSKWSRSDDLIFLDGAEVASVGVGTGEEEASTMLGAGLLGLGGASLWGAGAAGAAVVAGGALIGGGEGGGGFAGPVRTPPTVDQDTNITLGGDGVDGTNSPIIIRGTAERGSNVEVTIGDQTQETTSGEDGRWEVIFEGDSFPQDGEHEVVVIVTEPDGTETDLTGPTIVIDTTPPAADVTQGTVGSGDIFNAEDFENGVDISGSGEVGATVVVTVDGAVRETVVDADGNWSVGYGPGTLEGGERVADVQITATDAAGNTTPITDGVQIDTIPNQIGIDFNTIEGDGIVNGDEARAGIDLTGTATPGAEVALEFNGETQTVTASDAGRWIAIFDGSGLASGQYTMDATATSTDAAGNVNSVTGPIRIDTLVENFAQAGTIGGADGVINAAEARDGITVGGTGEPGMRVEVTLAEHTVQADVAANGDWIASFAANQIPTGTRIETMTATAFDLAGNRQIITTPVDIDTEAGHLTLNSDAIGGDGVINFDEARAGVLVTGQAPEGMLVTVVLDGVRHQVTAGPGNVWQTTYQQSEIAQGDHTPDVWASITDAAGNSARVDATVHVDTQVDNLNLTPPNLVVGTDGVSVINSAVAGSGFDVTGTIEPGSTVSVTIDGVMRPAVVDDAAGTWIARFEGGSIRGGQYDADITVGVRDDAGNVSRIDSIVKVDTFVDELTRAEDLFGTDTVVNAVEAKDGVTVTGTVEPGSTVQVDVLGRSYDATVAANGDWSVDIPAADIPSADQTYAMTVIATDAARNVTSVEDTLTIDTIVPDHPDIVGYFREGGGYRSVTLETPEEAVVIHHVGRDGSISEAAVHESADAFLGETDYHFLDAAGRPQSIPDGSQLIVTSTDAAGNASSTYVVLDETDTDIVNISNPGLHGLQIEAIDLNFGDQSKLTLTEDIVTRLSETSDTLVVHGGSDDRVTMLGAARGGAAMVDGEAHTIYTLGDSAQVLVDDEITNIVI